MSQANSIANRRSRKHGCSHRGRETSEYNAWIAIKRRCYYAGASDFRYYGGRGITVCERWLHSFPNFLADMGLKPTVSHTIDRIDSDGNYEPGNCRWATRLVQSRNRRDAVYVLYEGQMVPLRELADAHGVSYRNAYSRHWRGHPIDIVLRPDH